VRAPWRVGAALPWRCNRVRLRGKGLAICHALVESTYGERFRFVKSRTRNSGKDSVSVGVEPRTGQSNMRSVVSVWTRWGDYVLSVRDVRPGQALSVGSPPRHLVRFRCGSAQLSNDADDERALTAGQTVTVERDGLQYWITCSESAGGSFAPPRRWLAPLGGAAVAGALVAVLALLFVPRTSAVAHAPALVLVLNRPQVSAALPESVPVRVDVFAEAAEPQPRLLKPPGDTRCGNAEMGALVADARGRYGMSGPKDNADPHLARPAAGVGYPTAPAFIPDGELGFARTPSGSNGPTAPFGRDASLGTDAINARGSMWGDEIADASGEEGLGLAASPGGVVKRIDAVAVAQNATAALRVVHTGLRISGARKASEVGRAMAGHFDDFRRCAQGAALAEPLRVELDFDVAADGQVSATPAEVTVLEQCLDQSVARVAFSGDANAPAHVVYPLYFVPASADLRMPPAVEHPRPPPCDCGG
jgi:hypothetical protein